MNFKFSVPVVGIAGKLAAIEWNAETMGTISATVAVGYCLYQWSLSIYDRFIKKK